MDAERVEMQIAALLDQADVEHARIAQAIVDLQAGGVGLREGVTQAAGSAVKEAFEGLQKDIERARGAMKWFSYRWIFMVVMSLVGLFALGGGLAWALVALQRHQVTELIERKTALEADIAEMQVNAAALAKKGARIKIEDCGGRLCIVADKRQSDDATDWHGIWNNAKTGQTFVIPKGY
jgi:hypothetical protein